MQHLHAHCFAWMCVATRKCIMVVNLDKNYVKLKGGQQCAYLHMCLIHTDGKQWHPCWSRFQQGRENSGQILLLHCGCQVYNGNTLMCRPPLKKNINQLVIINKKKELRSEQTCKTITYRRWQCFLTAQVWQHWPAERTKWLSNTAHCCHCSAQPAQSECENGIWKKQVREKRGREKHKRSFGLNSQVSDNQMPTDVMIHAEMGKDPSNVFSNKIQNTQILSVSK